MKKKNQAEDKAAKERRQYERVQFPHDMGPAIRILGARITWNTQEVSDVYDLSFKGFAVSRPALVNVKLGAPHVVRVELGESPVTEMPVLVRWIREQTIGLEIADIPASAHLVLTRFLSDKLIGQNLRSVGKRFFNPNHDFSYWYQGPNSTAVFLWDDPAEPSKIVKVHMELDGEVWEFENRRVTKGEQLNVRAIQILGQIHSDQFQLKNVIEKVAALQ